MAAGTVTITEETYGTIKKIKFDWTSGDGAEDGTASGQTTHAYSGKILGLATDPGSPAPTALYDITVTDEDGMDVLMGGGVDRSATVTEYVLSSSLGAVANDKLTINVSAAGTNTKGVAYLYIR
ncbi:MAG: hypothetical protein HWN68_05930 [Desulfobacterales bacterium]|nr:hypothetical protein [Desulfobacterales bacterium]